jgi:hypothetical protein
MNTLLRLWFAALSLLLAYAWTAIVGDPGGDGYALILKPAPSSFHSVGHLEVQDWERQLRTGELPPWLSSGSFVTLARGNDEEGTPSWMWLYGVFGLATFGALAAAVAASARAALRSIRPSRGQRG